MKYEPSIHQSARESMTQWQTLIKRNPYTIDQDFQHSVSMYFSNPELQKELTQFAHEVVTHLEPLVIENNLCFNWPRLEKYNGIGELTQEIVHHPNYAAAGDIIYGSKMLARLAKKGGILESLLFFFLSGQAGEAGHNCPFACSAGIIRVLQKVDNIPQRDEYIQKLCEPSYSHNYTGAQFLTEIQGGSDVGQNATVAYQDEKGEWRIHGEKWFCSNVNADLILMTARFSEEPGTAGLALFLVPKFLENGQHNEYSIRRLKEKIGTCSMASGEMDFNHARAYPVGKLEEGFKLVMENVLHLSRLCNTFCMLGMARRAFYIAKSYAKMRKAFGTEIIHYPLVEENLATIKSESDAMLASIFSSTALQDKADLNPAASSETKLLLRLLANLNKYVSARLSVEHIHHSIDVLAGNGAIETFSTLPRLFRDSIVCENWEGTHNTLRMQILRDILKYHVHELLFKDIKNKLALVKDETRRKIISHFLNEVEASCELLKKSSQKLQSLQIRVVVDQLAYLFLATSLLIEADDQMQTMSCKNKLHSFDYFCLQHLSNSKPELNEIYLNLIYKIVQE